MKHGVCAVLLSSRSLDDFDTVRAPVPQLSMRHDEFLDSAYTYQ